MFLIFIIFIPLYNNLAKIVRFFFAHCGVFLNRTFYCTNKLLLVGTSIIKKSITRFKIISFLKSTSLCFMVHYQPVFFIFLFFLLILYTFAFLKLIFILFFTITVTPKLKRFLNLIWVDFDRGRIL